MLKLKRIKAAFIRLISEKKRNIITNRALITGRLGSLNPSPEITGRMRIKAGIPRIIRRIILSKHPPTHPIDKLIIPITTVGRKFPLLRVSPFFHAFHGE